MDRKCLFVLAAGCVLLAGPAAHADQISSSNEFSWSYKFAPGPNPMHTYLQGGNFTSVLVPGDLQTTNMLTTSGSPTHISSSVWTDSQATPSAPQRVHDLPFTLRLKLTDNASGDSRWITFRGWLNGNVWDGGSTLSPTIRGSLIRTVDINHHLYTVQLTSFSSPTGNLQPGFFHFNVTVAHNPEPSSLVLAGIGVPLLGGVTWRRRKKKLSMG
jgi:hypothetical protein